MPKTASLRAFMKPAEAAPRPARSTAGEERIQLGFRLPRSRWEALHNLATHERSSVQSIVEAALEAEFDRRGLPF